jgi:hypothetical protein
MEQLPKEIQALIFGQLGVTGLRIMRLVCRSWRNLASSRIIFVPQLIWSDKKRSNDFIQEIEDILTKIIPEGFNLQTFDRRDHGVPEVVEVEDSIKYFRKKKIPLSVLKLPTQNDICNKNAWKDIMTFPLKTLEICGYHKKLDQFAILPNTLVELQLSVLNVQPMLAYLTSLKKLRITSFYPDVGITRESQFPTSLKFLELIPIANLKLEWKENRVKLTKLVISKGVTIDGNMVNTEIVNY